MKKGCLYILFFLFLLNNTSFNQVFRLPALVVHFMEHHQLDHHIGFFDFLSMHYWGKDLNDNDQDKDNELPFKNIDHHYSFQIALPIARTTIEKQRVYPIAVFQPVLQDADLSDPALGSLFRPPRLS